MMKVRTLEAYLRVLKAAGVASCRVGDFSVTFHAATPPPVAPAAPAPEPVQAQQEVAPEAEQAGPLELPEGVFDPTEQLRRLNLKHGRRAS